MPVRRILVSAYACSPERGSEPGIGWNWATMVAGVHGDARVHVLVRRSFVKACERGSRDLDLRNLTFVGFGFGRIDGLMRSLFGEHIYYAFWQLFVVPFMMSRGLKGFDVVHHVTFGSIRFPLFTHLLGRRFILGPVAGGEEATRVLLQGLDPWSSFKERFRRFANSANRLNVFMNWAYRRAECIYASTEETCQAIPERFRGKTVIKPAIGSSDLGHDPRVSYSWKLMYAGNLLHWKGIHLAIRAFHAVSEEFPALQFEIVGDGNYRQRLEELVERLGLTNRVRFSGWVERSQLLDMYHSGDLFLFPSFHDSGGMVVLEAMGHGVPVICLDRGGPAYVVGALEPDVVSTDVKEISIVIAGLADRIRVYYKDKGYWNRRREEVMERARQFSWYELVRSVHGDVSYSQIVSV